jgi:hypothetical protein
MAGALAPYSWLMSWSACCWVSAVNPWENVRPSLWLVPVRLPRRAQHLSPAARTVRVLSGSTLGELGRVAAGRADPG